MMSDGGETGEIWLRSNMRPAVVTAAVFAVACGGLLASLRLADSPPSALMVGLVRAFCGLAATVMATVLLAASRPRLVRVGDVLRVRLALFRTEEVPLDVVECFFLGSLPLEQPGTVPDDMPTHRVGTLVVRLAERGVQWHERPTIAEWGTWKEGSIVCDGRWCEPLSADFVRSLTRRLVDAKRALVEKRSAAGVGP